MLDAGNGQRTADLYVDAHVHIYPFMRLETMLDSAARNLFDGRAGTARATGVLLVADPDGVDGYARLAAREAAGAWSRVHVDDSGVAFRRPGGPTITALPGRQLISREGLEVLGAGCADYPASGLPLSGLVAALRAAGGLAIVAWGAGKWLGRRGRMVNALIERESGSGDVMLADNAGRPRAWSRVPQFEAAAERGMRVLAGTDPLPLAGEEALTGSYGFRVPVACPGDRGRGDGLFRALATPGVPIEIVGRQVTVRDFVARQLKLRIARGRSAMEAA